jgi:RNA polymerase-associated protein
MRLYQVMKCPFAHRARIVLEEKKLAYEVVYYKPRERPAELERVGPDARSPTLFDDDGNTAVWDSLVVIEYLEERYPEVPLMPKAARDRARARLFMREVEAKVFSTMGPVEQEMVHKPAGARDEARVREAVLRYRDALIPWEARLEGQTYLLGDAFTLADVALYTPIAAMVGLLTQEGEIPEPLGALRAWRDRMAARPSTAY